MARAAQVCPLCHKEVRRLYSGETVSPAVMDLIHSEHPDWRPEDGMCENCHRQWRIRRMHQLLSESQRGISALDQEVMQQIMSDEVVARNLAKTEQQRLTRGERLADRIATFGGSWTFIGIFLTVLVVWMIINTILLTNRAFDPYPFILLNLMLSCLAAIQAPVILMSQNRQEKRDREEAENDYKTNLKAELEIRLLHDKIDHVLLHQMDRMLEIQELHTEALEDLRRRG